MNSILLNKNEALIKAEIILFLSDPKSLAIVVEGLGDACLFHKMIKSNVRVYAPDTTAEGVNNLIDFFYEGTFETKNRVIGIRDRDYVKGLKKNKHLFYYDHCNSEMMIIANDECFRSLVATFYPGKLLNYVGLRDLYLKSLAMLSLLRKMNSDQAMGWNFKPTQEMLCSFYKSAKDSASSIATGSSTSGSSTSSSSPSSLSINYSLLFFNFSQLIIDDLNLNNDNKIDEIIVTRIKQKLKKEPNLLDITNGHDFVNLFFGLSFPAGDSSSIFGKASSSELSDLAEYGAKSMRASFQFYHFKNTSLYSDLKAYEAEHNLFFLEDS